MTFKTRAETLAWLAADVELMSADAQSGRVPAGVTRPLHPHELHTDFADLERDVDGTAVRIAGDMQADRDAFIGLLEADLRSVAANPGTDPVDVAVAARIMQLHAALGINAIAGVTALVDAAEVRYRAALEASAERGAGRVMGEASRQNVKIPAASPSVGQLDGFRLDLAARRLAQTPHTAVLDAAAAASYQLPGVTPGLLLPTVIDGLKALSPNVLETTLARPAVQQADSLGRQTAMRMLPAATYYASELLDKNTCAPCDHVDGRKYRSLADGQKDYPTGGYVGCMGGDRCRGTLVAVWSTERPFNK